jgi:hypothetical protein
MIAFHEYLDRAVSNGEGKAYDQYVAGPVACSENLFKGGKQAVAVNTVRIEPPKYHQR